ncbi:hypothetical protein N9E22_01660 [Burkholderiales bacterium]|nr:hypothetical protein [Burkholderiales bacterium]
MNYLGTSKIWLLMTGAFWCHLIWQMVFIFLAGDGGALEHGDTTARLLDDTTWGLDIKRSSLALSGETIYSWQYNNPFYIYVIRFIYLLFNQTEHNFLLLSVASAFVFSCSAFFFYKIVQLLAVPRPLMLSGLYAFLPTFPFHTDMSSESSRIFCFCLLIYFGLRYLAGNSAWLVGIFFGSVLCAAFSKMYFLLVLVILVFVIPEFGVKCCGVNFDRNRFKSMFLLLVVGLGALLSYVLLTDEIGNFVRWLWTYFPEALARTAQDKQTFNASVNVILHSSYPELNDLSAAKTVSSGSTSGILALTHSALYAIAGVVYPTFSQAVYFDKPVYSWFYLTLSLATLIKLTMLVFILRKPRQVFQTWLLIPIALMVAISAWWGPNYDTVRYTFSFAPVWVLILGYYLNTNTKKYLLQNFVFVICVFALNLMITSLKRTLVVTDLKVVILIFTPIFVFLLFKQMSRLARDEVRSSGDLHS